MANYLEIKSVSEGYDKKIKQDLKFKTGNFLWKIIFNIPLNPATVNNQNLSVIGSTGKVMNTKISYDADTHCIVIEPQDAYVQGETYTLHVTRQVESKGGQRLKNEIDLQFAI